MKTKPQKPRDFKILIFCLLFSGQSFGQDTAKYYQVCVTFEPYDTLFNDQGLIPNEYDSLWDLVGEQHLYFEASWILELFPDSTFILSRHGRTRGIIDKKVIEGLWRKDSDSLFLFDHYQKNINLEFGIDSSNQLHPKKFDIQQYEICPIDKLLPATGLYNDWIIQEWINYTKGIDRKK